MYHRTIDIKIFCLLHLVIWTLVPSLIHQNYPLDVIESIVWGNEFDLGYHKHPPLTAWVTYLFYIISPKQPWIIYLLSQISIMVGLFYIYRLTLTITKDHLKANTAIFLLTTCYYYNLIAFEFNPNILLIPIWSGFAYYFYLALQRRNIISWMLVGIFAACAVMTKYTSLVILLFAFIVLLIPTYRKYWLSFYPYIAIITFIVILIPHFNWIYQHNFVSIYYSMERASTEYNLINHLWFPTKFIFMQFLAIIPALLIWVFHANRKHNTYFNHITSFIIIMGIAPVVILALLSLIFAIKLRTMWGVPFLYMSSIIIIILTNGSLNNRLYANLTKFCMIISLVVFPIIAIISNYVAYDKIRANFPGKELALMVDEKTDELNLIDPVIVGDIWLIGNVVVYGKNDYIAYIDNDIKKSPWILEYDVVNNSKLFITNDDKYISDPLYQKIAEKNIQGKIYRVFLGY
jgi:4-amino-4-deoxy-L-arabinose transferase-like glycosyltransferase